MKSVSTSWAGAITAPSREIYIKIEVYNASNVLQKTYAAADLVSAKISGGMEDGKAWGGTISQTLTFTTREEYEITKTDYVIPYLGVKLSDGTIEYKSYCHFFLYDNLPKINVDNKTKTYTLYDLLYQMSRDKYPNTAIHQINDITNAISDKYNISVIKGYTDLNTGNDYSKDSTYTYRNMLEDVAAAVRAIAFMNSENKLAIIQQGTTATTIDTSQIFECKSDESVEVDGAIYVNDLNDTYTSAAGTVKQVIRQNAILENQSDIVTLLGTNTNSYNIAKVNMKWRGNPALEYGDLITIKRTDNTTISTTYLSEQLTYDGGLVAICNQEGYKQDTTNAAPATVGEQVKETYAKIDKMNSQITLKADKIDLDGYVSILNAENGTTTINGACIKTGVIEAEHLNIDGITAVDVDVTGSITATSGTIGGPDVLTPFTISSTKVHINSSSDSDSDSENGSDIDVPSIYTHTAEYAGSAQFGIKADSHVYIGGDGFSYWDGKSETSDYNTAIRPSFVFCSGNSGLSQKQNAAILYGNNRILFYYGGLTNLRTASNLGNSVGTNYLVAKIKVNSDNISISGAVLTTAPSAVTSDRNAKNSIASISDKYSDLFDNLRPCVFKYNNGTSGRFHIGFVAQEVKDAIEAANMTTQDFAGFIQTQDEDKLCALRYEEFIALNTQQIQKLKNRVNTLEEENEQLKARLAIAEEKLKEVDADAIMERVKNLMITSKLIK